MASSSAAMLPRSPSNSNSPRALSSASSPSGSLLRPAVAAAAAAAAAAGATATSSSLENLISHLLASKRSLSSIHHVHRATTILSTARSAVEATTILSARTTYLHRSLTSQLKILRSIQFELEDVAHGIQGEFSAVLKLLDAAGKRLDERIQILRDTRVEEGFITSARLEEGGTEKASSEGQDNKKTLHDFVDDKPVEGLKDGLKAAIDQVQQAKGEMDRSIQQFEEDLQTINNAVGEKTASSSSITSDFQPLNIPALLKATDYHAKEMAQSLESLVKHFDVCVTAIRHTEGGGAAVAQNVSAGDLPDGVGVEDFEPPAQSIAEDERKEMMAVLENDAAEVEDVVIEIQDRNAEMEAQLEQILTWKEKKESLYEDVVAAFKMLEQVGAKLAGYVSQSSTFVLKWGEEKFKIEEGMAGMEELREVYENFLGAYDRLIVEVARRKAVKNQMEKVAQEAQLKLEKLYVDDLANRDAFRHDQGDFLPSDIWHGLANPPARFAVSRVDNESGSMPDLPRKTVEDAMSRLKIGNPRP